MSEQPSAEWCQGHSRGYERGFRDGLAKGGVEIERLQHIIRRCADWFEAHHEDALAAAVEMPSEKQMADYLRVQVDAALAQQEGGE